MKNFNWIKWFWAINQFHITSFFIPTFPLMRVVGAQDL